MSKYSEAAVRATNRAQEAILSINASDDFRGKDTETSVDYLKEAIRTLEEAAHDLKLAITYI